MIKTDFLGLDLGQVPSIANISMWATWIIPILSGIATFLSSYISMKQTKSADASNEQAEAMQRNMMIMMPLLITYISFKVPLGMGLYWFVNTAITILLQTWMMTKLNAERKVIDK